MPRNTSVTHHVSSRLTCISNKVVKAKRNEPNLGTSPRQNSSLFQRTESQFADFLKHPHLFPTTETRDTVTFLCRKLRLKTNDFHTKILL